MESIQTPTYFFFAVSYAVTACPLNGWPIISLVKSPTRHSPPQLMVFFSTPFHRVGAAPGAVDISTVASHTPAVRSSTATGVWGTPVLIASSAYSYTGPGSVFAPQVVLDASGSAAAVWQDSPATFPVDFGTLRGTRGPRCHSPFGQGAFGAELVAYERKPGGSRSAARATAAELCEVLRGLNADLLFRKASSALASREPASDAAGFLRSRAELDAAIGQLSDQRPRVPPKRTGARKASSTRRGLRG
jgi:hypothetical protein